jgi:hypothetical protein
MRRVEQLITASRIQTENEEFTDTTGIQDTEFIQYLNDAQEQLQSDIARNFQNVFVEEKTYDVIAEQSDYPLPDDAYLENRISNVWFSHNGQRKNSRLLKAGSLKERTYTKVTIPSIYIRTTGKFILSPIPQTTIKNAIIINYVKQLNRLDVRRGQVSSLTTSGSTITSLTLDPATFTTDDRSAILNECFLSVVDKCGDVKMRRVPIADINATNGAVTLEAGFAFESGESIAVGDYVVAGKLATNRCELPDMCERYLIQYTNWKILKRDSSNDSAEQSQELLDMRSEIVETFKQVDDDVKTVTITDTSFIDEDDLYIF